MSRLFFQPSRRKWTSFDHHCSLHHPRIIAIHRRIEYNTVPYSLFYDKTDLAIALNHSLLIDWSGLGSSTDTQLTSLVNCRYQTDLFTAFPVQRLIHSAEQSVVHQVDHVCLFPTQCHPRSPSAVLLLESMLQMNMLCCTVALLSRSYLHNHNYKSVHNRQPASVTHAFLYVPVANNNFHFFLGSFIIF